MANGIQQNFVTERFGEELYSSRLHRLHGYGNISVACDEDNRHLMPFHRNTFLQIETIESGKRNVQDQATRTSYGWMAEKILSGNERLHIEALMAKQEFERFANGDVVIDD